MATTDEDIKETINNLVQVTNGLKGDIERLQETIKNQEDELKVLRKTNSIELKDIGSEDKQNVEEPLERNKKEKPKFRFKKVFKKWYLFKSVVFIVSHTCIMSYN
jgi:hypothetical protein